MELVDLYDEDRLPLGIRNAAANNRRTVICRTFLMFFIVFILTIPLFQKNKGCPVPLKETVPKNGLSMGNRT